MSEELHQYADSTTPENVTIPKNWQGLLLWALGKWGVGAVFMIMVGFLYYDLRESNRQFAELVRANVQVMTTLAARIDEGHTKVEGMADAVRRIENDITAHHQK